ncbi:MAG: hypothetical protein ABSB83_01250 [Methanomassiliicoccales archaeon]|jgi:hypothetical protein
MKTYREEVAIAGRVLPTSVERKILEAPVEERCRFHGRSSLRLLVGIE